MIRKLIVTFIMVLLPLFVCATNSIFTIHGTGTSGTSANVTVTTNAYLCPDGIVVEDGASLNTWDPSAICGATISGEGDISLPVEISSFTAITGENQITLHWITESEIENLGFNIYRSSNSENQYTIINHQLIPGNGTSSIRHEYEYVDQDVIGGITYWYKLEDIDYNGKTELYGPVSNTPIIKAVLPEFCLKQNNPNPFNNYTTISYQLPKSLNVKISIYDINGRLVETIVNEQKNAGYYKIEWNADKVSSGVYFYCIKAGELSNVKKCLVIK